MRRSFVDDHAPPLSSARGRSPRLLALVVSLLLLVAPACRPRQLPPGASASAPSAAPASSTTAPLPATPTAPPSPATGSPRSQKALPTTSPAIAMGNLEAQLDSLVRGVDESPTALALASLANVYLTHGRIVGRISEYERADALTERAMRMLPNDASVTLARVSALSTFHRFPEALALLDKLAKAGTDPNLLDAQRAGIFQALGRFPEARAIRERLAARRPNTETVGALATLDGDEGRIDDAERRYNEALDRFLDVSPFPVAWLWLQQGTMWQREGRPARARELLAASVERLPQLAAAVGHLAAVEAADGARDRAEALLRPLLDSSDDPEFVGQLAAVLKEGGHNDEAATLAKRALARFDELLAAHPEAFADHAARFFLGVGANPARALALAERNYAARPTAEAALLVLDAATATGARVRACDAAEQMIKAAPRSVVLHHTAWKALTACDRKARADEVLRVAESLAHGK